MQEVAPGTFTVWRVMAEGHHAAVGFAKTEAAARGLVPRHADVTVTTGADYTHIGRPPERPRPICATEREALPLAADPDAATCPMCLSAWHAAGRQNAGSF